MKFEEAFLEMEKGKKLKSECFVVWLDGVKFVIDQLIGDRLAGKPTKGLTSPYVRATDWEIYSPNTPLGYEEEKRVKCIYCKKPIHINKFAGVNKEGMFCNGFFCLIELSKKLNKEEKEPDNWNLADALKKHIAVFCKSYQSKEYRDDIKTFIQKLKDDFVCLNNERTLPLVSINQLIDRRAGRL